MEDAGVEMSSAHFYLWATKQDTIALLTDILISPTRL